MKVSWEKKVTYYNLNASHQSPSQTVSLRKPWPARDFNWQKHARWHEWKNTWQYYNNICKSTAQCMLGLGQQLRTVFLLQFESSQRKPWIFSIWFFPISFLHKCTLSILKAKQTHELHFLFLPPSPLSLHGILQPPTVKTGKAPWSKHCSKAPL